MCPSRGRNFCGSMDKKDTLSFIRSLLISNKESYELQQLLQDFREENGRDMPLFGYKTPIDFLESAPDIVKLERYQQKIYVKPISSSKSAHITSLVKRQRQNTSSNRNFNTRTINNQPRNSKVEYQAAFRRNAFTSLENQMNKGQSDLSRPENLKIHEAENDTNSDMLATISRKSLPNSSSKSAFPSQLSKSCISPESSQKYSTKKDGKVDNWMKRYISPSKQDSLIPSYLPLSEVILKLTEIPKLDLSLYATVGEYVEVCVTEVWSPHRFFLILREFKIKLVEFMSELQSFYSTYEGKYLLTESLQAHQLCAVLYETNSECLEWYRAIILKEINKLTAFVFLIDYGTVAKVQYSRIRFLSQRFGSFPSQAFQGHLANIKYNGNLWTMKAIEKFYSMVFERDLIAGVVDMNNEESWLSVTLSYTDETDVHVNDTLVDLNLAVFVCDESDTSTTSALDIYTLHLYIMNWLSPSDIDRVRSPRSRLADNERRPPTGSLPSGRRSQASSTSGPNTACEGPVHYSCRNDRLLEMFAAFESP
ncbi:UNVERIFIED_CONTAM: hypothetical protein PYX00_006262 [Menopon gallinae]|uniref:Uncharacterized protein n=1 Tax=Menopon gallinae TaxID=328185 RepID=A0AAW2HV64_9NEOP